MIVRVITGAEAMAVGRRAGDELLERRGLSTLASARATVAPTGQGRLVLVRGEAGVGKTALVRRFCEQQPGAARPLGRLRRRCYTPRPLGPFLDVAQATGGELEARSPARRRSRTRSPPR